MSPGFTRNTEYVINFDPPRPEKTRIFVRVLKAPGTPFPKVLIRANLSVIVQAVLQPTLARSWGNRKRASLSQGLSSDVDLRRMILRPLAGIQCTSA